MSTSAAAPRVDRTWIATEFAKGIDAEGQMVTDARQRAETPPDPTLGVLYNEIAAADERHQTIVETIATRYGHTPGRGLSGGIGEALGRLRDKVGEMGTSPHQRVAHDLASKANAIHWTTAWIQTFEALGDSQSARELAGLLTEETAHRDALQEALNRMVTKGAQGEPAVAAAK